MLGPVIARLRVATFLAVIAALARRGFARVCSMLRLVMRPVRRALRLTLPFALRPALLRAAVFDFAPVLPC